MIRSLSRSYHNVIRVIHRVPSLHSSVTCVSRRLLSNGNGAGYTSSSYVNDATDTIIQPTSTATFREVPSPVDRETVVPLWRLNSASLREAAANAARDAAIMEHVGGSSFLERFDRLMRVTLYGDALSLNGNDDITTRDDTERVAAAAIRRRVNTLAAARLPSSSDAMTLRSKLQELADQQQYDALLTLFQYATAVPHHLCAATCFII